MPKWLREPLIHFLVLGGLLFFLYDVVSEKGQAENEIFISKGQQQNLLNTFSRTWQRLPTAAEYQGLLRDYIRQEIAYRESREMGLDQDDIVIRRRLRLKMEMLAEDVVGLVPPTEEELQAYIDRNPDDFQVEPRMDLKQLYFSSDRRGDRAETDALDALARLRAGDLDPGEVGDPIPLPGVLEDVAESEVERLFGAEFVDGLQNLDTGRWAGPVASGFGLHLVLLKNRSVARTPELGEVREAVRRELLNERRRASIDGLYDKLAENYVIEIEPLTDEVSGRTEGE